MGTALDTGSAEKIVVAVNSKFQLKVSITSGSHPLYTIDWLDGSPVRKLKGAGQTLIIDHIYTKKSTYAVQVNVSMDYKGVQAKTMSRIFEVEVFDCSYPSISLSGSKDEKYPVEIRFGTKYSVAVTCTYSSENCFQTSKVTF